jgi:hypothetical protein
MPPYYKLEKAREQYIGLDTTTHTIIPGKYHEMEGMITRKQIKAPCEKVPTFYLFLAERGSNAQR